MPTPSAARPIVSPALVFAGFVWMTVGLVGSARALTIEPEACALVSTADVARIVGSPVSVIAQQGAVKQGDMTSSACNFGPEDKQANKTGPKAWVGLRTFDSPAGARKALEAFVTSRTARHASIEADSVDGLPATVAVMPDGSGMILVLRKSQILDTAVSGGGTVGAPFRREQAMALLKVGLERLQTYVK